MCDETGALIWGLGNVNGPDVLDRVVCPLKHFLNAHAYYYHPSNACMIVHARHTDLPSSMPTIIRHLGVSVNLVVQLTPFSPLS